MLKADYALGCMGPQYKLDGGDSGMPLLNAMLEQQLILPGPLGLGVAIDENGSATGIASARIYPMGALLLGERFECTAVPELREQAKEVAQALLAGLKGTGATTRKTA
jgi:uncharacterized NAD(P)/FAD-binding protein YdhS